MGYRLRNITLLFPSRPPELTPELIAEVIRPAVDAAGSNSRPSTMHATYAKAIADVCFADPIAPPYEPAKTTRDALIGRMDRLIAGATAVRDSLAVR